MKIKYDVISDVGRERSNNEDMALVCGTFIRDDAQASMVPMNNRPRFSAIVADGMGGYGGGEIASEMTVNAFDDFLTNLPEGLAGREVIAAVHDWLQHIQSLIQKRQAEPELANMGTTLTGIFTYGKYEFMLNCGDSRVYRWRYDDLRQLSVDHSERQRHGGDLSIPSNLIYNAIGVPNAFIDVTNLTSEFPMVDGDKYIICSDGLSDMISDEKIAEVLRNGGRARDLVDAALEAGGRDNCTVIVVDVSIQPEEETVEVEETVASETPEKEVIKEDAKEETLKKEEQPSTAFVIDDDPITPPTPPTPDKPTVTVEKPIVSKVEEVFPNMYTPGEYVGKTALPSGEETPPSAIEPTPPPFPSEKGISDEEFKARMADADRIIIEEPSRIDQIKTGLKLIFGKKKRK